MASYGHYVIMTHLLSALSHMDVLWHHQTGKQESIAFVYWRKRKQKVVSAVSEIVFGVILWQRSVWTMFSVAEMSLLYLTVGTNPLEHITVIREKQLEFSAPHEVQGSRVALADNHRPQPPLQLLSPHPKQPTGLCRGKFRWISVKILFTKRWCNWTMLPLIVISQRFVCKVFFLEIWQLK